MAETCDACWETAVFDARSSGGSVDDRYAALHVNHTAKEPS